VYLSNQGKIKFIQVFEQKLYQHINFGGIMRTYDGMIKAEIQKLRKYIENSEDYKPYKYRG